MADNSFRAGLMRMFSQNVIVRKSPSGSGLKVRDTSNLQGYNQDYLKDKFYRIHKSSLTMNSRDQMTGYSAIREQLYRDYDIMDSDPIIASALDIFADECLGPETIIPLLNGQKKTIKQLYKENYKNFWIYGLDNNGNFTPVKADKVAYNGIKKAKKIILEDDTVIYATDNHIWLDGNLNYKTTSQLKAGDGLYALATKTSSYKSMNGYEMIQIKNNKFEFVHRIIGNTITALKNAKNKLVRPVLHHTSFDKKNNDPNMLEYMEWSDHTKLHREYNLQLWKDRSKNPEKIKSMIAKIKAGHAQYWNDERRATVSHRQRLFMNNYISTLSDDERKEKYGRSGSKNGMYNKGFKLNGNKNGRWKDNITRIEDIDINSIIDFIIHNNDITASTNIYELINNNFNLNLNKTEYFKLCNKICSIYNIDTIKQLKLQHLYNNNKHKLNEFRKKTIEFDGNPLRNFSKLSNQIGVLPHNMRKLLRRAGYSNYTDFVNSTNHRIKHISNEYYEIDVYDIVNAGENHVYAIESNDGSKIYTHNCTTRDESSNILKIYTPDDNVRQILENLYYDILNVDFNLWPWIRNLAKYGDFFLHLDIHEEVGIVNVKPLAVHEIERIEDSDPENPYYVKFENLLEKTEPYEYFEMAHFRLLSDSNFIPYGKSMLENGRRIHKQLQLMEDAMLIHRIMRAPSKRVFKIDIGNIPSNEVENYMNQVINKMKKEPHIDRQTGDYNLKYNIQNMTEDFYLPTRGVNSNTEISELSGLSYDGIQDIEYLKSKLLSSLKIPKAYLGYDESLNGKATLAQEDIRFARTIERIQRIIESELTKIGIIHLYSQGYTDEALVNFTIRMNNPSTIYTREQIEIMSSKINLIRDIKAERVLSEDWIYENILDLTDDQIDEERDRLIKDMERNFTLDKVSSEGTAEPEPKEPPAGEEPPTDEEPFADEEPSTDEEPPADEEPPGSEEPVQDSVKKYIDTDDDPFDGFTTKDGKKYTKKDFQKYGKKGGRPKHVTRYEKDDHVFGRDPIGRKDRKKNESILASLNLNKPKPSTILSEDNLYDDND